MMHKVSILPDNQKKKYPPSVFLPHGRSNRNQTRSNWDVRTSKFGDGKIDACVHHGCGQVEEGKEHVQHLCRCSCWNGIARDGPRTLRGGWFVDEDGNRVSRPATSFLSAESGMTTWIGSGHGAGPSIVWDEVAGACDVCSWSMYRGGYTETAGDGLT